MTAAFDTSRVGVPVASGELVITDVAIRAFAEATNEEHPELVAGRMAPPLYAPIPVLHTMVEAKNAVSDAFAFHGEHDLVVHEPLVAGLRARATATVTGVRQRSAGVVTVVHVETRADDGRLLNEQRFSTLVPGARVAAEAGEDAPAVAPPAGAPAASATLPLDADQTRRFAAATDDWDAYTLDEDVARSMGFPTIIVHGTCTLAFAARALVRLVAGGDPRRLRRFAARLASPLLLVPGQALTVRTWPGDGGRHGFDAIDNEGTTMLKNGLVEVTP